MEYELHNRDGFCGNGNQPYHASFFFRHICGMRNHVQLRLCANGDSVHNVNLVQLHIVGKLAERASRQLSEVLRAYQHIVDAFFLKLSFGQYSAVLCLLSRSLDLVI